MGDETLRDVVAKEVATAARDFGFFYVRGHGIGADLIADADDAMREFFALPDQAKQEIAADKTRALKTGRGYVGLRAEQLDISQVGRPDLKEVLDLGLPLGESTETYLGANPWPAAAPRLQSATEPYLRAAHRLGVELLSAVARSIGLPEDSFEDTFDEPLVVQRLMHYPAAHGASAHGASGNNNNASSELGCGAHYDFGGLTLLHQSDASGLEVQPPAPSGRSGAANFVDDDDADDGHVTIDGAVYGTMRGTFYSDLHNRHANQWVAVAPQEGMLVVSFGEAMQRLTNGQVQATRHRVVHSGATARHSMAVFVDPNPHKEVAPLPELLGLYGQRARYSARLAGHKTVLLAAAMGALQQRSGAGGAGGGYLGFGKM